MGPKTIGTSDFEISEAGESFDTLFPPSTSSLHMLGADTHSLLAEHKPLNAILESLQTIKAKGYRLILSGHHTPEPRVGRDTKIASIEKVRNLANQGSGKEDFITRVDQAFSGYKGFKYLEMTANCLFSK